MKKIQFKFYCAILCNKIKKMKQDWKLNINDAVLQFQRSTLIKVDSIYKNQFRKLLLAKGEILRFFPQTSCMTLTIVQFCSRSLHIIYMYLKPTLWEKRSRRRNIWYEQVFYTSFLYELPLFFILN